ncbi:DUF6188 family protein [Glycomyces tarimensis]
MMETELAGQTVAVSDQAPLTLRTSGGWVITIESSLEAGEDEAPQEFQGDEPDSVRALAARLHGLTIRTAAAHGGTLEIDFAAGPQLTAGPDPDFEAWSLTGPAGQRMVCMPGGELATWS